MSGLKKIEIINKNKKYSHLVHEFLNRCFMKVNVVDGIPEGRDG